MKVLVVLYLIGWVGFTSIMLTVRKRLAGKMPPWQVALRSLAWPVVLVVGIGSAIGQRLPLDDLRQEEKPSGS